MREYSTNTTSRVQEFLAQKLRLLLTNTHVCIRTTRFEEYHEIRRQHRRLKGEEKNMNIHQKAYTQYNTRFNKCYVRINNFLSNYLLDKVGLLLEVLLNLFFSVAHAIERRARGKGMVCTFP